MKELDEDDLVRILREPKNALTKQYERLFDFDNIRLRFTEGAMRAIAQEALKRKAGARGLRSVMETAMLDVMYDLPSEPDARECVISEQVIINGDYPVVLFENTKKKKSA
jgi:ATP-dependent Clp protease ATP-binding subunit ClpX